MSNNKKVSIVVPVFNVGKYIKKCIDSIIMQTYKNIELILINDGSTDNSDDICQKYAKQYNNIIYISQENKGVSYARNVGINKASGDFIMFIDSDDYIDNSVVETLVLNYKPNILVSILHSTVHNDKVFPVRYKQTKFNAEEYLKNIINGKVMGSICVYLFEAKCIKSMKFDTSTNYLEDMIFITEYLKKANIQFVKIIDSNCFYNYVYNDNSITTTIDRAANRCQKLFYVSDRINKITNYKYKNEIENMKIRTLEKELKNVEDNNVMISILNNNTIKKYTKFNIRYIWISHILIRKKIKTIKLYYWVRKKIKKLYKMIFWK